MTIRPILFSEEMIRALLDGRKTMTRRMAWNDKRYKQRMPTLWRLVKPGDLLWVREKLTRRYNATDTVDTCHYPADLTGVPGGAQPKDMQGRALWPWPRRNALPAVYMPRWASRLTLAVTATKMERLQNISKEDIVREGVVAYSERYKNIVTGWHEPFAELWNKLHGPGSWESNPEIICLTFIVHKENIDDRVGAA